MEIAFVDQGDVDQKYTGENATQQTEKHGVTLCVVKLEEAKRGFISVAQTLGCRMQFRLGEAL